MRFFRSTWLQKILLALLLVLLNAGPFGFVEQADRKDELVIHATQFLAGLSSPLQQPQIKYGFDVVLISAVTVCKKIISVDYIPGTPFDPFSADPLSSSSRGPPRLINIL